MLGFRSSKCKTACKLCVSRIKLTRNKREVQLTQQRRAIGELLKQGKNEYAWIRVEAIIRERNLLAAYEILELFLELIAVRVELLDKHKTCPKVADLPELVDVRKWLNLKFGRELGVEGGRNFEGAEPPRWQVNLRLRQYLAVEAPEPEDKLTMISSIAQEVGAQFDLETYAQSVMVQLDPAVTPAAPPIPQVPTFQAPPVRTNGGYPTPNYGIVPPSVVAPSSPLTKEPDGEGPVRPPPQPSFRAPYQGPSVGPYTDAQVKMTGSSTDVVQDPGLPPTPTFHDPSYNHLQKQYDDVPSPPKKEAFHEEEADEDEAELPSAPVTAPPPPPPPVEDDLDNDLSRRLSELPHSIDADGIPEVNLARELQMSQSLPPPSNSFLSKSWTGDGNEHQTTPTPGPDRTKHPSGIVPQLQNVVATCYLGTKLDLKHIAMYARNAEYNPKRFAAVIMRIREPKTTALVFSSGKMVCTGAKSEQDVRLASRKFARIIQKLGFEDAKFRDFKVQNIVGSCDAEFPIRLEGLHYKHSLFSSYEPELFPGLIYRMKVPKVVLLIFVSGKVVLTGAKTREEIYQAFETIYPALVEFRKGELTAAPGLESVSGEKRPIAQREDSELHSFHSIMSNINSLHSVENMNQFRLAPNLAGVEDTRSRKRTKTESVALQGSGSLETIPSTNWNLPPSTPRVAPPSSP